MSSTDSDHKFPVLDGLRATSILLVLACHLLPLGPKALRLNETAGAMGMSLFFALSGFLITSGLMKNADVHEFAARRLARILPLAYAYTLIVFAVFTFNPRALLWTDLFTVNYLTQYLEPGWTSHLWSLCVEIQFYISIAVVVLISGRKGPWLVWPACLAITLLRIGNGAYISLETHLRVDEILSGACTATLLGTIASKRSPRLLPLWLGAAALMWAISSHPSAGWFQYFRPYATALMLFLTLKYGIANPKTILSSAPAKYIATISYALYVVHPATAHGWMSEGGVIAKYLLKRPASFCLSFFFAHLSTFYWERPWQMAAKRWIEKRRQAALAGLAQSTTASSPG